MVRTSDFQFANVGSNPANPNLTPFLNQIKYLNQKNLNSSFNKVSFYFLFASLIAPNITTNFNFLFQKTQDTRKKLLLKNSYVILAWFYYISCLHINSSTEGVKFFVLPVRSQVFTLTKAPIGHKLHSKEQYKFVFYLLRISFVKCALNDTQLLSLNQGLLFLLTFKKTSPMFSSNIMTLKNNQVRVQLKDVNFFNYKR